MPPKIYFEDESVEVPDLSTLPSQFEKILAAGGLVLNDKNEILFIYRREKWDLPKGKWDEDESLETCARREVAEETGLETLNLERHLVTTYHTYAEKKRDILKETHWYLIRAPGTQELKPQQEEDITRIEWVNPSNLRDYTTNSYSLIADVLLAAGFKP